MADTLLPTVGLNVSEGRFQSAQVNPQIPLWSDASKSYERVAAGLKPVQELALAIKDYQDGTELNKALNEYHRAANAAYAEYAQLQGEDSVNGHADFGKTQDALLKEYGDRLEKAHPNLRARFDAQASKIKSGVLMNGDTVYAKNAFDLGIKERDAKVNLAAQDFSLNLGSPNEGQYLDLYSQAIDELADVYGIPKGSEAYKVFYQQNIDKGIASAITYQIDTSNFGGAGTALQRYKQTMSSDNYLRLSARLQNKLEDEALKAQQAATLREQRAAAKSQRELAEIKKLYEPMSADEIDAYKEKHYEETYIRLSAQNPNMSEADLNAAVEANLNSQVDIKNAERARMKTGAGVADTAIITNMQSVLEQTQGQPLTAEEIQDPMKIFERTQEGRQALENFKHGYYQSDLKGLEASIGRAFSLCRGTSNTEHNNLAAMSDYEIANKYPDLDTYFMACNLSGGLPRQEVLQKDIETIQRVQKEKASGKLYKGNSYYTDAVNLISSVTEIKPKDKTDAPVKYQFMENLAATAVSNAYQEYKKQGNKGNIEQIMKAEIFKAAHDPKTASNLKAVEDINNWSKDILDDYAEPSRYNDATDNLMRVINDLMKERGNDLSLINEEEIKKRLDQLNAQSPVKFLKIEDPDSYKYTYNHGKQNVKPSPRNSRNGTGGFVWGKGYYY